MNHQELVHARFGKKRGAFVGFVESVSTEYLKLKTLDCPLQPGDGLVIDTGEDTDREQGGRVYQIKDNRLYFEHGKIRFPDIPAGARVWKTDDPKLDKALRQTFSREIPLPGNSIDIAVSGKINEPLRLACSGVAVSSQIPLQRAEKRPLNEQTLRDQLGRLGGTPFSLGKLELHLEPGLILPLSELNRLRRELVDQLPIPGPAQKRRPGHRVLQQKLSSVLCPPSSGQRVPALHVLCRTQEQMDTALQSGARTVYLDFEDIRRYRDAVTRGRESGSGSRIYLATPRIQKAGEEGFFRLIENAKPDGVLVRNIGGLEWFRERDIPFVGDFSLNVANPLTAALLMEQRPERLTLSYDLNADQVRDLLAAAPPAWFEITLHQHMPLFHMEHCVFAAFLSKGKDATDCGRPCEKHDVRLRDRVGLQHPLKADVGCRNTIYHGKAQSGALFAGAFLAQGLRDFRVELLDENAEKTARILRGYRELLEGTAQPAELMADLHAASQLGVTSGTLTVLG